ncbi:MAG: NACHT domain-containing protein [Deltaproteobacteria bacterium]|nr:NACHT domain-containing protein [Deltaproteobacteria bacterium]
MTFIADLSVLELNMGIGRQRKKIDKVRASRDGHEFHEAWTARKATQLLWPDTNLTAIAVEGPSPADQAGASAATVEVADLTFYYGRCPNFEDAARTTFAQFKYSIANQNNEFRASHAKKTVEKFGATYRSFKRKYGAKSVEDKLDFQLVTNQPISGSLVQAIDATATGASPTGDVKDQAEQFAAASGLSGKPLMAFAQKLKIIGRSGSLPQTKDELANLLVDWSATSDPIAAARLGKLRELVRDKAGYAGTDRNLIRRTDVLAALQIGDPKDLLPCAAALVDVGEVLEREQLREAMTRIGSTSTPLLIHATGGVGKTVFMGSLASKVASDHEVVFFDCFGGGAYRSPEDARHLPKRGLIHIANTLAFRGLCDPMLPDSPDVHTLLSTFRRRLTQCLNTISRMIPGRKLAIFIDAIDNAAIAANQASEDSFPIKLLECLDTEPIDGVKLVVSCRTERKPNTYAQFDEFELCPFSKDETGAFLRARLKSVTDIEVNVAQARSGGNPRVLDYLVKAGRGLLDPSEINKDIELDDLIQQRITNALSLATKQGYEEKDLSAFLAGLAVLPPPVPMDEYAAAHGMGLPAIESFASDLSPLLERTNHGLMFRDEPTETLIHKQYATSRDALERVASNLLARQDASVYAARALPRLLHELDDGERLFALAFDDRIPASITSTVGKRNIQYARLKAATLHAALKVDYNSLVRLLVELSTIAEIDQRGANYLLQHPDLVVAAKDVDAQRRLFEIRTDWPGTRHARLAIVNILLGDPTEATRHAHANEEWIQHYRRTDRKDFNRDPFPDQADIAATSFFLISEGRPEGAAGYLTGWRDWFVFEVSQLVLGYTHLAILLGKQPARRATQFIDALSRIGPIAAALSFQELPSSRCKPLCVKLAALCNKETKLDLPQSYSRSKNYDLEDGLRKSAAVALSLGLGAEAQSISQRARHDRPGVWAYRDVLSRTDVFAYTFWVALLAAAKKRAIHEQDILPKELVSVCACIPKTISGKIFRENAKKELSELPRKPRSDDGQTKNVPVNAISYDEQQAAERFLDIRLEPLLTLTRALSAALAASTRTIDKRFVELVEAWEQTRKNHDHYRGGNIDPFFQFLGFDVVLFTLWSRSELKPLSIQRMLTGVHAQMSNASDLVRIIAILAQRTPLHAIAGEQAVKARTMIEKEDEVTYRASLFGALGRAILPASLDESAAFFRNGLEQMDAIGSGDYQFTNELLLFASEMKGDELEERDFHTLSNICELNMGEEPEKFFWGAYGRGMAKAAGMRGLAKLSRWDDRNRIALGNTLLPYLTGLLETGKIDPKDALCLNRLANPVEYFFAGTKEFAKALRAQAGPNAEVIKELITQFEDDNPTIASDETVETLYALADEALGASHDLTKHLEAARDRYETARQGRNAAYGSSSGLDPKARREAAKCNDANREALARIAEATDPADETSLVKAIDGFNAMGNMYDLKGGFFSSLRAKVPFAARGQYVRNVANLEHLFFYWKFAELKDAKEEWGGSSAALAGVYRSLAQPLILAHAHDLVDDGRFSGSNIKEISEFTGVSMAELVLEVIKVFSRPDSTVAGSVWLAFASFICPEADEGQGQLGLKRLLSGDSARIADNVTDGPWKAGCYPADVFAEVAAGLIWRVLGSPHAVDRWRAAHCIRRFVKFGRWDIVDKVVASFDTKAAAPYQAPELAFYYLHARLWLLIALARAAFDHPEQVARYRDLFLAVIKEKDDPHVLMNYFAAKALIACVGRGKLTLDTVSLKIVHNAEKSPHPRLRKKSRNGGDFYQGRPKSVPEPSFRFHLEYDFNKHDVDNLGRVFGRGCWEVDDMISSIAQKIDPAMTSMYEDAGRESRGQNSRGITTSFDGYGQQLGWHALFIAAGKLLAAHPVTDDWWYEDDPWRDWLGRYVLTRKDGLWLSDGTDRTPHDASVRLLESKKKGLVITGDQKKIIGLAAVDIEKGVGKELIVQGRWYSSDGVEIGISSALVPPQKAKQFAKKLIREKPMLAWVPAFQGGEDDDGYLRGDKKEYSPWIVCPFGEARLDEHDPYGVPFANFRPRLAQEYSEFCKLTQQDAFGCFWKNNRGTLSLRAQAWGRAETNREEGPHPGLRLLCTSSVLNKVLRKYDKDLLLLVKLQRYKRDTYRGSGRFSHSIVVVLIDKSLNVKYFKGRVNYPNKSD